MSFTVNNFEVKTSESQVGFAFSEDIKEGQKLYFLGSFSSELENPGQIAETIFGAILEQLQNSQLKNAYDQFEEALKAGNEIAKEYFSNEKPDTVIAFFDFHQLYLSQSGSAESYLIREQSLSQISEASEKGDDLYLNILSGEVTINDTIVFSSDRILRSLTTNQILQLFMRDNFTQSCSLLKNELQNATDDTYMTVCCVGIGKKDESATAGFFSRMKLGHEKKELPEASSEAHNPLEKEISEVSKASNQLLKEDVFHDLPKPSKIKRVQLGETFGKIKTNPNLRKAIPIAGVIFVAFVVIIGIRALLNYESVEEKELRASIDIAREALVQADTFLLQGERNSAQEYLAKAEEAVGKVAKSKSQLFRSDVGFILAEIDEKKLRVENAKKVTPNLVTDLSVKNDNLESQSLMDLRGNLFVNDSKNVYKTIRNIVEKGVPISEKETIIAAASRPDQNTLVYLSSSPRLIEYREGVITPMNTSDETWKQGIGLQTYGRYVYVLDPIENQIWKYERRSSNYSPAAAYNNGADLSRAVSFGIDGSIYILTDDGEIKKLFRGAQVDYDFRDLPSLELGGKNLKIYTSANLEFLYVLDPDNQRLLVFVKGDRYATYKKQVMYGLPDARDFIVDDSGQKVHLLTKDKIYTFSL
ncbi:MAG TPA: hypothetical protein VIT68_03960 [Candidatus Gracilibacteria bacterium]